VDQPTQAMPAVVAEPPTGEAVPAPDAAAGDEPRNGSAAPADAPTGGDPLAQPDRSDS
jgi:hypothetical protein